MTALVALAAVARPAAAHHSHASLNVNDVRLYQGVVTRYSWRMPHVYLQVNVATEDGGVKEYLVEALNPPAMQTLGWDRDTFRPGDLITWEGPHDRDPDRGYAGIDWAETPDGRRLIAGATDFRRAQRQVNEELAGVEVQPVGEIGHGNWARIAADGSPFPAIRRPEDGWPLTGDAAADVAGWSEDDNPINLCIYGGPPRSILSLSNFQWSRPDDRTIVIDRDMWLEPRVIHLDPDAPRGEPSRNGHSVGWFEGDELHVYTDNFIAETWGMYTGIDSTAQKTLRERYWLSDGGMRLNVEFTVEDPGVLTAPHTKTHQWKRVPDRPLVKVDCSIETAWLYKTAGYSPDESGISAETAAAIVAEKASIAAANPAAEGRNDGRRLPPAALLLGGVAALGIGLWRLLRS